MKFILDILNPRKPFLWVVLFLFCSALLFSPDSLLKIIGLNLVKDTPSIKTSVGIIWLICLLAIICNLVIIFYRQIFSFFKIKILEKKIVKELIKLSYPEKLLLYIAVKLNIGVVYIQIDNSIAQTLVSKGMLIMPIRIADPLKYPFRIPDYIWKLITLKKAEIFKEFENKKDEELMREYQSLL